MRWGEKNEEDEEVSEEMSDTVFSVLSEVVLASTTPYLVDFLERELKPRDELVVTRLRRDVELGRFDGLNPKEEAALEGANFRAAARALAFSSCAL